MCGPTRTLLIRVKRCSRPLCSSQRTTRHRPSSTARPATSHRRSGGTTEGPALNRSNGCPLPQDPTARLRTGSPPPPRSTRPQEDAVLAAVTMPAELVSVPPSSTTPHAPPATRNWATDHGVGAALDHFQRGKRPVLLRKEVIQPHLPVRLPCYDFVPIADPAFDGSLPQGVGPPASGVTDFRDVTGGVYKARERIHRSVADLRLLATPTSWGRVADPNPN